MSQELKQTPLHALHAELGAKFVPFAGYDMPVQYPAGILKEHIQTRAGAGLFDVSHMGQVRLTAPGADAALERLVPGDIAALSPGEMRYTMFTNDRGGVLDDLMVTRRAGDIFMVVNAGCKTEDLVLLRAALGDAHVEYDEDRALLALQGPGAAAALARHAPGIAGLGFMKAATVAIGGTEAWVSRAGYTGEDGFEISLPGDAAEAVARLLLGEPEVAAVGLGARDSLRLEAGLCLYGNDLTPDITPIEAGLTWTISKRRREAGGFRGDAIIKAQIADGPSRRRVGIKPAGRAPARAHTAVVGPDGAVVGEITSGGFGPSVDGPVAMGYVTRGCAKAGTEIELDIRGKRHAAAVVKLPFTPHRYAK
ncbi:MAG: glycine cleavage system aminomethyltransferase GcvT [Proteobacteria bacterium]|nr:glycine cleavage system aminomethyltransferase GcvT [Pseudomonadota bacterium]